MGYKQNIFNSSVEYGFGQMGSAFVNSSTKTLRPPKGMAIVAIQFLADTELNSLVAEDSTKYINTAAAAQSGGTYTRTVDGVSSVNKVTFDQYNEGTGNNDDIEVGDEIYDSFGSLIGTVTVLNPDGNNTKEISRSSTTLMGNNTTVTFLKPNRFEFWGIGGFAVGTSNTFPKGTVIYGRWESLKLNDNDGILVAYFGN